MIYYNDAFIAYRKAYEGYRASRSWSGMGVPHLLKEGLLRVTEELHLQSENEAYRRAFPDVFGSPVLKLSCSIIWL